MSETKDIVLYRSKDGTVSLDVQLEEETIWLTQAQLSKLFQTERSVITKHIRNIFNSNELNKNEVCAKFAHTAADGKTYQTQFYNLDAIISENTINSKHLIRAEMIITDKLRSRLQNYRITEIGKKLIEDKNEQG